MTQNGDCIKYGFSLYAYLEVSPGLSLVVALFSNETRDPEFETPGI